MNTSPRLAMKLLGIALVCAMFQGAVLAADFEAGMNYFKAGKYVDAAAEFQAIVEESPDYDYGYFILGHSFLKMKKQNDAIENFRKAIDLNGDKFEYHLGLAQAYFVAGNFARTAQTLSDAEGLVGNNTLALHTMRGTANYELKKWSSAIEDLEAANKAEQNAARKANNLMMIGKSYDGLRTYDKAANAYEGSVKLSPSDQTMIMLAIAQQNAGGQATSAADKKRWYSASLATAEKLVATTPNDFDAVNTLGRSALGAEQFAKAVSAFDKALAIKPDYCPAMINKAKAYQFLEDWKAAESTLAKASNGPCDGKLKAQAVEMQGFTYRKMDRLQESLKTYELALQLNPSSTSIMTAIAEVKQNIETDEFNLDAAAQEAAARAAKEAADAEYEAQKKKVEEWEHKREDQ